MWIVIRASPFCSLIPSHDYHHNSRKVNILKGVIKAFLLFPSKICMWRVWREKVKGKAVIIFCCEPLFFYSEWIWNLIQKTIFVSGLSLSLSSFLIKLFLKRWKENVRYLIFVAWVIFFTFTLTETAKFCYKNKGKKLYVKMERKVSFKLWKSDNSRESELKRWNEKKWRR